MKRKLDDYTAEARPFKRFKLNPIDDIENCLNRHFHVGEYGSHEEAINEELEPLPPLEQALLFGSEKEFRDAISPLQDLNQLIGGESYEDTKETVLMIAITRGFTEIAIELLQKADLTIFSSEYQHALHYACENDNDEVALAILDIMKDDEDYLNALDNDFMTPLFYAAQNGNKTICKRLLTLGAKQKFFAEDYDSPEEHQNNVAFCARYFAADSLDVETFKLFINNDVKRDYGGFIKDKEDLVKYFMACTLIEPFLVQYMNDLKDYNPYDIHIAQVTMDGLRGDESAEPSVDEGGQLESALEGYELIDLCRRFFPDKLECQYYLWKYAIGCNPKPIHAIIMGDLDILKYLLKKHKDMTPAEYWPDYDDGPVVAQTVISFATSNNDLQLLKYICEDLGLLELLGQKYTFEIPPDVTGQIRKYLKSLGGVEDKLQVFEYFEKEDPSLVLYDYRGCWEANDEQEVPMETLTSVQSEQEGPIVHIGNDVLIEILTHINAPHNQLLAKVCKRFSQTLQQPEFWRCYWTKRVEFAVMSTECFDWTKVVDFVKNVEFPTFRNGTRQKGLTVCKLANISAMEGTFCYEIINLTTGKKELVEQDFYADPFVRCAEDETINFGDISPITSPNGHPALYNAQKVMQFIPSGKITLKTIQIKDVAKYWSEETLIKNCYY